MLAWLLSSYLQQAARERILAAVQEAAQGGGKKTAKESSEGDAPPELPPCQIAILCAHEAEAGGLIDLMEEPASFQTAHTTEYAGTLAGRQIVVVITGAGRAAVSQAAEETIRIYRPEWIVAAGFASGLAEGLRRRHIVMPSAILSADGRSLSVGFQLDPAVAASTKSLHVGPLLSVAEPLAAEAKRALAEQGAALAIDTESFFVADVCRATKTRFLSLRVISDAVDDAAPPDVEILLRQKTVAGQLGAGIMAVWRRLGAVGDLWQLQEDAVQATDTLARFVSGIVPQLVGPPGPRQRSANSSNRQLPSPPDTTSPGL